jgi:hypothetical protein
MRPHRNAHNQIAILRQPRARVVFHDPETFGKPVDDAVGDQFIIRPGLDDRHHIIDGKTLLGQIANGQEIVVGFNASDNADERLGIGGFEFRAGLFHAHSRWSIGYWFGLGRGGATGEKPRSNRICRPANL